MSTSVASRRCLDLAAAEELEQDDNNNNNNNDNNKCHFQIINGDDWGVHVIAVDDMTAGTVITRSVALSHKLLLQHKQVAVLSSSDHHHNNHNNHHDNDDNDDDDHHHHQCAFCLLSPPQLYRCSSCKDIRYCGRNCQREDFVQHKYECKYLRKRRHRHTNIVVSQEESSSSSSSSDVDEICLLLRTYGALMKLNQQEPSPCRWTNDTTSHTNGKNVKVGTVCCGLHHWKQMAMAPPELLHVRESTIKTTCKFSSWTRDEVIRTLRIFQANNFGIMNDLYETVAQGVYPHAALLNHSCDPTCLLRFHHKSNSAAAPVLEIVALRDIIKGEELTHSYVDLVSSTRQTQLTDLHGFVCSCRRCQGVNKVNLPSDPIFGQHSDLYDWILNQTTSHEDCNTIQTGNDTRRTSDNNVTHTITMAVDEALLSYGSSLNHDKVASCLTKGQRLMQEAQLCMQHDNLEGELAALMRAVAVMKQAGTPPLSRELYRAHGMYLSCLLVHCSTNDETTTTTVNGIPYQHHHFVQEAEMTCRALVAFLCIAMPPNHPLLGLQLFTLGDLTPSDTDDDKKKKSAFYRWSRDILRISHGEQHDLVSRLNDLLLLLS